MGLDALQMKTAHINPQQLGKSACGVLPLQVLKDEEGFYIGTWDEAGDCRRESVEHFDTRGQAISALAAGRWTPLYQT
jgi:hypothetical protein